MACYNDAQKISISLGVKKYFREHPEAKDNLSLMYKGKGFVNRFSWLGKTMTYATKLKIVEKKVGGFWYGNVKYPDQKYCEKFDDDFKERVRAYWGWECVVCGKAESAKRRLHIHHVHYDKKMCCNGSPKDVVALCPSCHMATNFNRSLWEKAFTDLIYSDEFKGKSYLTKTEMSELLTGVSS